jgi:hypothetical protein
MNSGSSGAIMRWASSTGALTRTRPRGSADTRFHRFARRLRLGDHVLRVAVHVLADLGDRELARRALQQPHAEVGFQLRDAPAQARFRDAERALGGGIAPMLDDAGEELQVVEVRQAHSMRSRPPMYGRSASGTAIEPSACW